MSCDGLAAQQSALAQLLRRASPIAGDPEAVSMASEIAAGNPRLSPAQQVDIYREQYLLRHVDALREDFGALAHLLDEDAFYELAFAYLAAHPPSSFTLRDLGRAMTPFVTNQAPWSEDPLLGALTLVEWAFVEAFDALQEPPLDPRALAAIPEDAWPGVRLTFQPAVKRLAMALPAHEYRLAVRAGGRPQRPPPRATFVVVYRGPEDLRCLELDAPAYVLLDELARGTPLGEACEAAAATSGAPLDTLQAALGGWFQQWASLGWISRALPQEEDAHFAVPASPLPEVFGWKLKG